MLLGRPVPTRATRGKTEVRRVWYYLEIESLFDGGSTPCKRTVDLILPRLPCSIKSKLG
jgi:hypothetical protein